MIADRRIAGVSFTGSTLAGSSVASLAGKYLKKSVLELGGSDPFLILEDADMDKAVEMGVKSRLNNNGQACISAKRFIVQNSVFNEFREKLEDKLNDITIGDPLDESTDIGPLARDDLHAGLTAQI